MDVINDLKKIITETDSILSEITWEVILCDLFDQNRSRALRMLLSIETIQLLITTEIYKDYWLYYLEACVNEELLMCQCCGFRWAIPHSSRTCYQWDGEGVDPNADINLCPYCAMEHHSYWDDMWVDYWGSKF